MNMHDLGVLLPFLETSGNLQLVIEHIEKLGVSHAGDESLSQPT